MRAVANAVVGANLQQSWPTGQVDQVERLSRHDRAEAATAQDALADEEAPGRALNLLVERLNEGAALTLPEVQGAERATRIGPAPSRRIEVHRTMVCLMAAEPRRRHKLAQRETPLREIRRRFWNRSRC